MPSLCLYFHLHQPYILSPFPFFEIGQGKNYFDDDHNRKIFAHDSHELLSINSLLLTLINRYQKKVKVNFCISGIALEQAQQFNPKLVNSFQELSNTNQVEFIGTTYSNSLSALSSKGEFTRQAFEHNQLIQQLFSQSPKAFQLSRLEYTDAVFDILYDLGYTQIVLEGSDSWSHNGNSDRCDERNTCKIIRNKQLILHDKINLNIESLNHKDPSSISKSLVDYLAKFQENEGAIIIGFNLNLLGVFIRRGLRILECLEVIISESIKRNWYFISFSDKENECQQNQSAVSFLSLYPLNPNQTSVEKFLGNEMQQEAFFTLYDLEESVNDFGDLKLRKDWTKLQSVDHLYYMDTSEQANKYESNRFNPYNSPFQAFIN
jgi:alpha-amylase